MSLISTVEAVPSRLEALWRTLRALPRNGAGEDDLLAAFAPAPLKGDRMARQVYNEAKRLRLIVQTDDGKLAYSESNGAWPDRILALCADGTGNEDVLRIMAFLLQSDGDVSGSTQDRLRTDPALAQGLGLNDNSRVDMVEYWAEYFGFGRVSPALGARGGGSSLVPDATAYLQRALPAIFAELGSNAAYAAWREALGLRCPIWDGTRLAAEVRADFAPFLPVRPDNRLQFAEAVAWLRLQERGAVKLAFHHDAPRFAAAAFGTVREFTHVEKGRAL